MNRPDLTIRPATLEDAKLLATIQARVFASTYGTMIPQSTLETYLDRTFALEQVVAELNRSDSLHLVAAHTGTSSV